jgi:hypothetical protein
MVKNLTIEVNFVISESDEVRGGLDFKIITAGGKALYKTEQIHKIVLELEVPPWRKVPDKGNKILDRGLEILGRRRKVPDKVETLGISSDKQVYY